jgi:hypothetical protein
METTSIDIAINRQIASKIIALYGAIKPLLKHLGTKISCWDPVVDVGCGIIVAESFGLGEYKRNRYALAFTVKEGILILIQREEQKIHTELIRTWEIYGMFETLEEDYDGVAADMNIVFERFDAEAVRKYILGVTQARLDKIKKWKESLTLLSQDVASVA